MRLLYYLAFLLLLLTSCQSRKEESKPEGEILPERVMIEMLIDTHLSESAAALNGRDFIDDKILYAHYETKLVRQYKTDTTTYLRSLDYYLSDIRRARKLYTAVYDSLEKRKARRVDR